MPNPSPVPTRQQLRQHAGSTYFERGEQYFAQRAVLSHVVDGNTLSASIRGSYQDCYKVRLTLTANQRLDADCSCPLGEEGSFCKHAVAAGLAWIEAARNPAATSLPTMDDVRQWLSDEADRDTLVELLMRQALDDDALRERLLARTLLSQTLNTTTADASANDGLNLEGFKEALDESLSVDDDRDYYGCDEGGSSDVASAMEAQLESWTQLLDAGHPAAVVELTQFCLPLLDAAISHIDDSEGELLNCLERVCALHLRACLVARPDPRQLAATLLQGQLEGEFDVFCGAPMTYYEVLGDDGLAHYQSLAQAQWDDLPAYEPHAVVMDRYGRRSTLRTLLTNLLTETGSVDDVVEVLKKDQAEAYDFVRIVSVWLEAGRYEEAVQWAEDGLWHFDSKPDARLLEQLVTAYQATHQPEKARATAWRLYANRPSATTFERLKGCHQTLPSGELSPEWPTVREQALTFLREQTARETAEKQGRLRYTNRAWLPNHQTLVEILLFDGDIDGAWQAAQQAYCADDLRLKLAVARQPTHPRDALFIYQQRVETLVDRKKNDTYREAVKLIRQTIEPLMRDQLDDSAGFKKYLSAVKTTHRLKRNFLQFLDDTKAFA